MSNTSTYLVAELIEDIKKEFEGYKIFNEKGELVALNVYPFDLPIKQTEDDDRHYPFIIIKLAGGKSETIEEDEIVTVLFVFGIYDANENKQGASEILNLIEKTKNHFINQIYVKGYKFLHPFEWSIQDEDTHPYYFGGLQTNWEVKKMRQRESEFI